MHSKKQITLVQSIIIFLLITCLAQTAKARSVYVITNIGAGTVKAYSIQDDEIEYQATAENLQRHGDGAVGLALDPDSEIMFVTYEGSEIIEMLNAKTMLSEENPVTVTGAANLAGIAFDREKQKLYVVHRESNILYVYLWDPEAKTLILEGGTYKILSDLLYPYAYGIALDESANRLYVTNATNAVCYYDTNDPNFDFKGSIDIVVNGTAREAVGIAIDSKNRYMYTGSFEGNYGRHTYLVKTDINDINNPSFTENDVGAYVIGVAADNDTGLVYVTTYDSTIEVYNPDNWPAEPCDVETFEISGVMAPAGICLAGNCSYKPHVFDVNKVDNVNDVDCAYPWNEIDENYLVYNICYDANGFADTNVIITDHLPDDVNYFSSEPCGDYNSTWHTVTWDINDISGADSNCLQLTVKVKQTVKPGETIINLCEMEGDLYYTFTTRPTDICCYGSDIIYVDADANGFNNGTSWLDAYEDLQDAFTGAANCDCRQIRVAQQTYRPTDINDTSARSISFELVNNVAVYGGFPPGGGTWQQRNPYVYETMLSGDIAEPNNLYDNSYHVVKCEDVNNAVLDGFIITAGKANGSGDDGCGGGIYCKNSNNIALTDCNVSGNSASIGGALYIESSDPNITSCIFSNNLANSGGGAIYNTNYSEPNVINCIFTDNTASASGGGMYNYQSSPTLLNCIFTANTSTSDSSYGGGIGNHESSPTIISCIFSGNSAYWGGGISNKNYSEPNVINCIFTGNDVMIYTGGGIYSNYSMLNVTNSIFTGNKAANYHGGGMYNYNCPSVTVTNCIFSGNGANIYGGGISNIYSDADLTNCTFSENRASEYGGGLFIQASNVNLTNSIFWDNEAAVDDEIYKDDMSDVDVNYSDVKGGWSGGVGNINEDPCFFDVEQSGSWSANASYDNSTFQSTLTDSGASWAVNELAGRFVNPDTNQALQFFIVSNGVNTIKVWSDVTDIAGEGDSYYIYDYHLTADSNCIDTGDPDYNPDPNMKDIDGELRVFDGDDNGTGIVDMGADEYYWSPADFNSDGLVNFFDYALIANVWLTTPNEVNYYDDIYDLVDNDRIDNNDLARFCEDWLWQTAWAKTFPFAYQTMGCGMGKSMGESPGLTQEFLPSPSANREQPELTAADIEEIIKWLEDLWLTNEEVRKTISEDDWLKFIESVKQALKEELQN
jgi:hypothetical protein